MFRRSVQNFVFLLWSWWLFSLKSVVFLFFYLVLSLFIRFLCEKDIFFAHFLCFSARLSKIRTIFALVLQFC